MKFPRALIDSTLFSDLSVDDEIYDCIIKVKAKPFDADFDLQMDASEELYGVQLKIDFAENDIINAVDECKEYYDEAMLNRIKNILLARKNKLNI